MSSIDTEYNLLINDIIGQGFEKKIRNGSTLSSPCLNIKANLTEAFPIITTKKVAWKHAIKELLWHLGPDSSNINGLGTSKHIWEKWADKDGYLSSSYGRMWRKFPLPRNTVKGEKWSDNEFVVWDKETRGYVFDQIAWVVNELKVNPGSRRLSVSAWHPANATVAILPPCQPAFTFNVVNNLLVCSVHARSQDCALGLPFDLIAYAALTQIIAKLVGLIPWGLYIHMVDAHIYSQHVEALRSQVGNIGKDCKPKLIIKDFNSIEELTVDHFSLENYESHEAISYELIA